MNQQNNNHSLLEMLNHREKTSVLLIDEARNWSVSEVIEVAINIRGAYSQFKGKAIILALSNKIEFILWLCALDGFASKILLASEDDLVYLNDLTQLPQDSAVLVLDSGIKNFDTNTSLSDIQLTKWCLLTSGTTAKPKLIAHSLAELSSKVTSGQSGTSLRWGLLYQQSRFAGLQVILQALLGNGVLVVSKHQQLDEIIKSFVESKVDALSATPSYWRRVLMTDSFKSLSLSHITLGGEIVDDIILQQLKLAFPTAKVRHVYASTEAGVGFSVRDGKSGFPKALLVDGQLEVQDGYLWLLGADVTKNGQRVMINSGDLVRQDGERIFFLGREHGVINIGGNKVFPESVETKIRALEDVDDVRVFAKSNPIMGQLVAADIVPAYKVVDESSFKQHLIAKMRKILQKHEVPMLLFFKQEIALSHNTKVTRN